MLPLPGPLLGPRPGCRWWVVGDPRSLRTSLVWGGGGGGGGSGSGGCGGGGSCLTGLAWCPAVDPMGVVSGRGGGGKPGCGPRAPATAPDAGDVDEGRPGGWASIPPGPPPGQPCWSSSGFMRTSWMPIALCTSVDTVVLARASPWVTGTFLAPSSSRCCSRLMVARCAGPGTGKGGTFPVVGGDLGLDKGEVETSCCCSPGPLCNIETRSPTTPCWSQGPGH